MSLPTVLRRRPGRRTVVTSLLATSALLGGIAVAGGPVPPLPVLPGLPLDNSAVNTSSLDRVVTAAGMDVELVTKNAADPTAITVAPDGRILVGERRGSVKVVQEDGTSAEAGRLITACTSFFVAPAGCVEPLLEEGGLHGLEVAADFADTGRFYAYYSAAGTAGTTSDDPRELAFRLSSFVLREDSTIDPLSEQVLLEVPAEYTACCHYGGDIDLLADGTLLLTTGDDTSPRLEGWNPRDERPGQESYNAERTSQDPRDRRGKVLRLMPDGSVPDGSQPGIAANPFVADPAYDPYVYAMGFRSNWRMAPDLATGTLFVGNVGPDASAADANRGPAGHDELETVPPGGGTNHGWPRCIADNKPYQDYDYLTGTSSGALSCEGMTPATLSYTYAADPLLGSGGRTAVAGVVYRAEGARALPEQYQDRLFFIEWSRGTLFTIPVFPVGSEKAGQLDTSRMEKVAEGLNGPSDMTIAPDGSILLVEYGGGFYENTDSRIVRLVPGAGGQQFEQ